MTKALVALLLFLAGPLRAAPEERRGADEAIKADGYLALDDGSSFFVFLADGKFKSFPSGFSGRHLDGTWTSHGTNPVTFTVEAERSWPNGNYIPGADRRRIVLVVYNGSTRPGNRGSLVRVPHERIWTGYFIIEQFVRLTTNGQPERTMGLDEIVQSAWPELDAIRMMPKPASPPSFP